MAKENSEQYDVEKLLKPSNTDLDFVVDGVHFGRGDSYYDEISSTQVEHKTLSVRSWKIVNERLEQIEEEGINRFYNAESYIVQWKFTTENFTFNIENDVIRQDGEMYFYWKGEDAIKGYSPLPEEIEKKNPSVERIVQWAEPPIFLQLFSGRFIVHIGKHNHLSDHPHLYILRGEIEKEIHLFEVELKKENLRSRTSFVLYFPNEKSSIIWHGNKSNAHSKNSIKQATEKIFGSNITEVDEGSENKKFLKIFKDDKSEYFVNPPSEIIDYTPRLFYFNKIIGKFSASEVECSHKSSHVTSFPFLQSHLYTADQPAVFLLDDYDEIWIWYGWTRDEDEAFKSDCFVIAINYAKQKSKIIQKLVRVHKVIAGFEPNSFTNLFPVWKKREDVVEFQEKEGLLPNSNPLIEVIGPEDLITK